MCRSKLLQWNEFVSVKFLVDESAGLAVSQKLKQMSFDAVSAKDKRRRGLNDEVQEGCSKAYSLQNMG